MFRKEISKFIVCTFFLILLSTITSKAALFGGCDQKFMDNQNDVFYLKIQLQRDLASNLPWVATALEGGFEECKEFFRTDERKIITRIEVIKVTPQAFKGEQVDGLISDPWKVFNCEPNQQGCEVEFSDGEFNSASRDASYYVRAIQEPSPAVNAGSLRCTYDDEGNCLEVNICYGDNRTAKDDDCLVMSEERAWSSPIYLNYYNI